MYILSNGTKVTEKEHMRLCQAVKDDSEKYFYFLDIGTGKLVRVPRTQGKKLIGIKKEPQRFVPLPKVTKEERRERFRVFVEELGVIDVPELQKRLSKEIKKGTPLEKLEEILEKDASGWIHGWVQDEQFLLAERIEEWITAPPLNARDDPDYWYDDNCPVCQLMRKMEEENRSPTLNETYNAFKKAKEEGALVGGELFEELDARKERKMMEAKGFKYIGTADNFKMPKWMECSWRRVSCGKDNCPICGRIKRDRQRHIERGEDPDDIKSVLEDVSRNFKEVMEMIKRDCEARGIELTNIENVKEPPGPEEFPFYKKVKEWNKSVMTLGNMAQLSGEFWIQTEEAADLFWYANTLLAKTYRQLCNKWHIKNDDEYGDFDYQYTKYVLKECLKILKKSLKELIKNNQSRRKELNSILLNLRNLEKQIIKI